MKKKKEIDKNKKIPKEFRNIILISIALFVFGCIIFKQNKFIFSVILGCIPYGYSILGFITEDNFKLFGKLDFIICFLVKVILGSFIGIVAFPIIIGFKLLDNL